MPAVMKRLFAVLVGRGWIEIREAKSPPKPYTSEITTYKEDSHWRYNDNYMDTPGMQPYTEVKKKIPVKRSQTIFRGGKVVHTMKASRFSRLLKIAVRAGGILELSPEMINQLNEKEKFLDKKSSNIQRPPNRAVEPTSEEGPVGQDCKTAAEAIVRDRQA